MRLAQDRLVTVTATLGAAAVAGATAVARKRMAARSAATSATTGPLSARSTSGGDKPSRSTSEGMAGRDGAAASGGPRTAAQIVAEAAHDLGAIEETRDPSPTDPDTPENREDRSADSASAATDRDPSASDVNSAAATAPRDTGPAAPGAEAEVTGAALSSYARLAKKYGTETDTDKQTTLLLSEVDEALDPAVTFEADPESRPADDAPDTVQPSVERTRENPEFARFVSNSLTGAFVILGLICQFIAVGLAAERDSMFLAPQALVVVLVFVVYAMRTKFNSPATGPSAQPAAVGGEASPA